MLKRIFKIVVPVLIFAAAPVFAQMSPGQTSAAQTVTDCDLFTAHGSDPDRIAPGVSSKTMDTEAAIRACLSALAEDPRNPRLQYQMGRAYGTAGLPAEARPYLVAAADAGYAQSQYVLAYLMVNGFQGGKDVCAALPLFVASAEGGLLAALVALPYHTLRGDFDICPDAPPSEADLSDYLANASALTGDYYATLLIEELTSKLAAISK